MGKIKKRTPMIIAGLLGIIAVMLLIFPTISNAVCRADNKNTITIYNNNVSVLSKAEKEKYLSDAQAYNRSLTDTVSDAFTENTYENIKPDYESVLDFGGGQICSIEIPKINVRLPVYHGTSDEYLKKGAVHSANTSFPIGGNDTHCVISAHTAYPGKVFFDDLTELEEGDIFYINILDERLIYRVCDIRIVEPQDTDKLQIVYGSDLVTLVTCYPYAVNSHRLLVTGKRAASDNISTADTDKTKDNGNDYIFLIIITAVLITVIAAAAFIKIKASHGGTVERTD